MAGSAAQLIVDVLVNAGAAQGEINSLADAFGSMGKKLAGIAAGAAGLAGLGSFANAALNAASNLEQAMGGVDAVFKENASMVHRWAADTSDNIRLPAAEFESLALIIGSQLKNAGVPMDELAQKTKTLIQLGGDLSAAVGGTTVDAVSALSSALKGEFDPMERYGVALSAAAVNTEALKIAQGDAAKAAERSVKVQATLALITRQTADFQGQAAREADTYAASQEHLNEVWTNFLAAAGAGAIAGAGGILDLLADALTFIQPLVVAIGQLAGAFLSLSTPILATIAVLGALMLFGPKIAASFMGMKAAVAGEILAIRLQMQSLQLSAAAAGTSMTTMGSLTQLAGIKVKAALAAFGGPWMLAFTVLLTVATFGLTSMAASAARTGEMARQAKGGIQEMADAIRGLDPSAIDGVTEATSLAQLKARDWGKESKDLSDFNDRLGVSTKLLIDGMQGVPGASDAITAAYDAEMERLTELSRARDLNTGMLTDEAFAAGEKKQILEEMMNAYRPMIDTVGQAAALNAEEAASMGLVVDAGTGVVITADAISKAYDNLKSSVKAAADSTKGQGFLDAMAESADRASRAAEILGAQLDRLSGRVVQTEQAQVAFQRGLMDTGDAFKDAAGKIDPSVLTEWNYEQLNASKEGQAVYDSLTDLTGGFNENVAAAFAAGSATGDFAQGVSKASDEANASRAKFIGMHDAMGLTEEQAGALATKLGILDGMSLDISILADDAQAQASLKQLEGLHIDPKTIVLYADDKTTDPVESAISYIDSVTGETKMIHLAADATSADQVLQTVIADILASHPEMSVGAATTAAEAAIAGVPATAAATPAEVPVAADTVTAQTQINAIPDGVRDVAIEVGANTTIAQSAITALTTQQRTLMIQVTANAAPATQQINSVTGAKWATVISATANPAQAVAMISAVANNQWRTMITVFANASPAVVSIVQACTNNYRTIIVADANTGPAQNAIRAVTQGTYTATITVTANVSQAQAAIAAIPRSVGVSYTPPPPPPAPAPAAFAAPKTMAATPFAPPSINKNVTVPASIVINVQGGLDSADTIGRRIENVMTRYERRRTGIQVGRPSTFGQGR